jgi:hypothetical protein
MAVFSAAVWIRVWQIRESLWLDELHTAWVISGSPAEIAQRARIGNQSPFYFWLPAAATDLFGASEWGIRLPSLVAGLGLVVLAFGILFRWTYSLAAAVVAAALIAIDRHCIFYAQEARPYACVQLTGLLHVYLFWKVQKSPSIAVRSASVATGVCMFWLHYTSALLFLGEAAWYVLLLRWNSTNYRPRWLAADAAVLLLGAMPTIPHLLEISGRRGQWNVFIDREGLWTAVRWFSLDLYVLLPMSLAGLAAVARTRVAASSAVRMQRVLLLLPFCWFAVPVTFAWIVTCWDVTRLFFPRYLIVCVIAPIILASMAIAAIPWKAARAGAAIIVIIFAAANSGLHRQFLRDGRLLADRNQDWRGAITWLNGELTDPAMMIFLRSGLIEADYMGEDPPPLMKQYWTLPVRGFYRLTNSSEEPVPLPTSARVQLSGPVVDKLKAQRSAWLIVNGNPISRPRSIAAFQQAALEHGLDLRIKRGQQFGDVLVVFVAEGEFSQLKAPIGDG